MPKPHAGSVPRFIAINLLILSLMNLLIWHLERDTPTPPLQAVQSFMGTYVGRQHSKAGTFILVENEQTKRYTDFWVERYARLTNAAALVRGRPIKVTAIGRNLLTCEVDGVNACQASCLDSASCGRWDNQGRERQIQTVKPLFMGGFGAAAIFGVLSYLLRARSRKTVTAS